MGGSPCSLLPWGGGPAHNVRSASTAVMPTFREFNRRKRSEIQTITTTDDTNGIDCARMFMLQKYCARNPMADPFSTLAVEGSYLHYCFTLCLLDQRSLDVVVGLSAELRRLGYCTVFICVYIHVQATFCCPMTRLGTRHDHNLKSGPT